VTYFDELADQLRRSEIPDEQVTATIEELAGHLAETGADPEDEYGPVHEFADQLAEARGSTPQPEPDADTWRWIADAFVERRYLAHFGAQGWEITHVDHTGHFVCRRDLERPQRWEYRREIGIRRQQAIFERLAPDGWELCGGWGPFHYFKRPVAASVGPAAELSAPPVMPQRRNFLSKKFWLFAACLFALMLVLLVVSMVVAGVNGADSAEIGGMVAGVPVGAAGALVAFWFVWRRMNKPGR
jgi:hypothetical protein